MVATMRVGAGTLREPFSRDLLEEIRIMAEAAQAPLAETLPPNEEARSPFAAVLARILATTPRH